MPIPKKRILLVEGYPDTRAMMIYMLEQSGFEVTSAGTCTDAFQLAKHEVFDLYLLDGLLTDGTGVELCRQLRLFDQQTPILFHSALAYKTDQQKAFAAGAQAYLVKPTAPAEISNIISGLIEKERVQAALGA